MIAQLKKNLKNNIKKIKHDRILINEIINKNINNNDNISDNKDPIIFETLMHLYDNFINYLIFQISRYELTIKILKNANSNMIL